MRCLVSPGRRSSAWTCCTSTCTRPSLSHTAAAGLRRVSEAAVLHANYLRACLSEWYDVAYDRPCMHEVLLSGRRQKAQGARTLDVAKRLIDYGFHPPTIYFPLVVDEAMMIEPTETEAKPTLDAFVQAMIRIK